MFLYRKDAMTVSDNTPRTWKQFVGHKLQQTWFQNAIAHDRLASTFLMVGPDGVGKRTFCKLIAKTLLCTGNPTELFDPCCRCEACAQMDAGTHPDLIEVARRPEKTGLILEQFIGEPDARMREGLCYELRMRPYSGRRKIAIVDDADTINEEGANCLLKTLEEPPPGSIIFLISNSIQRQLPTIRSRSQISRFLALKQEELSELLLRHQTVSNADEARLLAQQANGSLSVVTHWTDEELKKFREEMFGQLDRSPMDFTGLAKAIQANMESVGTESQARRERLKILIDFATHFYRDALLQKLSRYQKATVLRKNRILELDAESLSLAIRRCIEAREHLDRMVGPTSLIEAWATDLAVISRA